jgi:hypothetical protein
MKDIEYPSFHLGKRGIVRIKAARLHIKLVPIKKVKFGAARSREKQLTLNLPGLGFEEKFGGEIPEIKFRCRGKKRSRPVTEHRPWSRAVEVRE